jgi:alcohol dehydrogenase/benzil reductase ((S)-benzoin forming)
MKNVLITGSSSGLGFELADVFKKNNYDVYGLSKSKSSKSTQSLVVDFSDRDNLDLSLPELIGNRNFEYLFLNAGILGEIKKIKSVSISETENALQINVLASKQILDYCIENGNRIKNVIAISSGASTTPYDGMFLYCLTKAAFRQLISCYAIEYKNIHFISLAPGIIKTKMQDYIYTKDATEFPSLRKFHDLYDNLESPCQIAEKIFNNLNFLKTLPSGEYYDLRRCNE